MQHRHHGFGRVFLHKVTGPDVEREVFELFAFADGRVGLGALQPLAVEHGQYLDRAFFVHFVVLLAERCQEDVDVASHQVQLGRGSTLVRHVDHGNARDLGQLLAQQVVERAGAHAGIRQRAALLGGFAGQVQKLIHRAGTNVLAGQERNLGR